MHAHRPETVDERADRVLYGAAFETFLVYDRHRDQTRSRAVNRARETLRRAVRFKGTYEQKNKVLFDALVDAQNSHDELCDLIGAISTWRNATRRTIERGLRHAIDRGLVKRSFAKKCKKWLATGS